MKRRARIIAWAFIPAALILGAVALLNYALFGRVTKDLITARNGELARLLAEQLSGEMEALAGRLRALSANPDIYTFNTAAQHLALRAARDDLWDYDAGVVVLNAAGRVTAADDRRLELVGADWSGYAFLANVANTQTARDWIVSNARPAGPHGTDAIVLAVPIWNDESVFLGAVAGIFRMGRHEARITTFYENVKKLLFETGGTTYLVEEANRIVYHPDTWHIGETLPPNPAEEDVLTSSAPVPGTPWRLVIEEDWAALMAASAPYQGLLLALLALGLLLPVGVVWVALKNVQYYARAEAAAAAAERSRLARELHDAVSQTLFSANMIAGVLPRLWERQPDEARRQLTQLQQLTKGAQAEMRTLLLELRPEALAQTALPDLLEQLVQTFSGREIFQVEVNVPDQCEPPPDVKIALYRIAQEAIHNTSKHAHAEHVALTLTCDGAQITLRIADDGRGFDPHHIPKERLGQRTMHERAEAIGARLEVESAPGQGTTVTVHLSE